jgi:rod shape-determining protein MreB
MGSNLIEGVPKIITVEDSDICEALAECIVTIIDPFALRSSARRRNSPPTSPTAALTSGSSLIKNLVKEYP